MKKLQYIAALVLLSVSLPVLAQTKEYVQLPQESVLLYPTQTTYSWRSKDWPVVDGAVYKDTAHAIEWLDPDTIYSLKITTKKYYVMPTHHASICITKIPYQWRHKEYREAGTYSDTVVTTLLKDTIYTLQLAIGQPSEQHISFKICQGDKVEFQGRTYTSEGVDTISLTSSCGCDSVYFVDVRVGKKTLTTTEKQICEGDAYLWHKQSTGTDVMLTTTGYYYDSLVNTLSGCDSILCIHLVVNKPHLYKDSVAICEHQLPFLWHGYTLNETGIYYDTIRRSTPCDSIVRLALTVLPDQYEQTNITFCGEFGTRHNGGDLFYHDTMFIDTFLTAGDGCYRIVKTTYLAGSTYRQEETKHRSEDYGPFTWRGQVYEKDGTHVQSVPGVIGCDSTWILHLMTDYTIHQEFTFCDGSGIYYKNRYITEPCHVIDSLTTLYGGDSVVIANFTHKNRYAFTEYDTICANEDYTWEGHDVFIDGPGTYFDANTTVDGCDSTYTLYLFGNMPIGNETYINISRYYESDSLPYIWECGDTTYVLSADTEIVRYYGHTSMGCDSMDLLHFHIAEKWSLDTAYLCHGEVVRDGHRFTEEGDYEIWLYSPSARGDVFKDSVLYLHVDSAQLITHKVTDSVVICKNETPYYWHDRPYYSSRLDSIILTPQREGYCDSMVYLNLTVLPTYKTTITHPICQGDYYEYKDSLLTQGTYYDTLTSHISGCDSIIEIIVNVMPTYFYDQTDYFLPGTTYQWHGKELSLQGIYWDSCQTMAPYFCDSVYRLELYEKKIHTINQEATVCDNELPYHWREYLLYKTDTYYDTVKADPSKADSIFVLNLQVNDTKFTSFSLNKCVGDTFLMGNKRITESGTYYDSLYTTTGCDSVVRWIINFLPRFFQTDIEHMRNNATFEWHGMTFSSPGTYYDINPSAGGCDSTYRLILIGDPEFHSYDTITTCHNQPFEWYGTFYNYTTDLTHKEKSQYDKDSVEHLHLIVNSVPRDTSTIKKCNGDVFYFNNKPITQTGTYSDTLRTSKDCDSISTIIAQFYPNYSFPTETIYLLSGRSFVWHDTTITTPGIYYKHYPTAACGCDSSYVVEVILADTFSYTESAIVCQNELPYHWRGRTLNEAGYYTQIYPNPAIPGADSIYHIQLTVAPNYIDSQTVSICPGETIHFFNQQITQPGIYRETLLTTLGCDSLFILNVNPARPLISHDTTYLCQGQSLSIVGKTFSEVGEHTYITPVHNGCDSIMHHVIIYPKYFVEEYKTINEGGTYKWLGHKGDIVLSRAGYYFDTLPSIHGCDSVVKLTLKVNTSYFFIDSATICRNEAPYIWRGQSLNTTGIYYDSLSSVVSGLDSVYCFKLTVNKAIVTDEEYDACDGETVYMFGKTYTTSTIHYDTTYLLTCPQVTRTAINFHRAYHLEQSYQLSEGERYVFIDTVITTPGFYVHKGTTQHGCDSIVELTVTACKQQSLHIVNISLCSGDSLRLGDTTITSGCVFTRSYISHFGCDSLVQYNVHENPTYHFVQYANFCENSSYQWMGHKHDTILTKEGRYDETFKTINGCDSIYTLYLTALPTYLHDTVIYRCPDEIPYIYKGAEYFIDQDFIDTFHTVSRCDSICITRFRINQRCSSMDLYTRCQGDMMIIDEQNIIDDGEYRIPRDNDSIHRFKVFSYSTYDFITHLGTHCDSVTYLGVTYYAHSISDTLNVPLHWKSIHGCDSIEHLKMVLYRSAPKVEHTQIIYDYASVLFGGQLYSKSGDYERNYHTVHGCDSTYLLHLTVIPTDSTGALHYQYCSTSSESIEVFGKLYHPARDTIIYDTTAIPDVNMWIIKKAIIRVNYPFTITSLRTESEVCAQPILPINIIYTQNGSFPQRYELDFLPNQLIVNPSHHEGLVNGKNIIEIVVTGNETCVNPGDYAYKLRLTTDGCPKSDTTIYSSLSIQYPSSILESFWNNTVSLVNREYNDGHWNFQPPYNWQITDATGTDKTGLINPNQNLSYLYSNLLTAGDRIYVSPMREGYDKAVTSCEYIFFPSPSSDKVPILVLPTAVAKRGLVQIQASIKGSYQLFNSAGSKCQQGTVIDGTSSVQMPGVSGFYILKITLQDGSSTTERLIVY